MLATFRSAAVSGVDACPVQVEVDVSFGLPLFAMVGLPDASVRESRDRVRSAIRNSGFEFPPHRITVNLAPADVRKAGSAFDLPIALAILAAQGVVQRATIHDIVILGELSLDGRIQPTRGVLPIAAQARRAGLAGVIVPAANASEAAVVGGLRVWPVHDLADAVAALNNPDAPRPLAAGTSASAASTAAGVADRLPDLPPDLVDVRGQGFARRALEVAAAGGHNLLLVGPPGAGKTLIARRLPGILPPLTFDEALEVTAIHSVAGLLPAGRGLVAVRPFRAPHHTVSTAALIGGGPHPRPGEISLAHHGVLFLDEVAEFPRFALDALRQPLEEGQVTVTRLARTAHFPARFVLVAAMNPCPCGYAGDPVRECRCTPQQVVRYAATLSGPLRDRLDLTVTLRAVPPDQLDGAPCSEPSAAVRLRVEAARHRQRARTASDSRSCAGSLNSALTPAQMARDCPLPPAARHLLTRATSRLGLSARGWDRVRRVARTIADLAGEDHITADHVAESLHFR